MKSEKQQDMARTAELHRVREYVEHVGVAIGIRLPGREFEPLPVAKREPKVSVLVQYDDGDLALIQLPTEIADMSETDLLLDAVTYLQRAWEERRAELDDLATALIRDIGVEVD